MKKIATLFVLFICLSLSICRAHGGGLDRNGGHYNRKTGHYHYHSGKSSWRGGLTVILVIGGIVYFASKSKKK